MKFAWLKRWMPRSLYGRAALILIVPIVAIQLVVSIVFLQRHFDDVTRQMTSSIVREISFLLSEIAAEDDIFQVREELAELREPLAIRSELPAGRAIKDGRLFYDLTGRVLIDVLISEIPQISAIDLSTDDKNVALTVPTQHGELLMEFHRGRVTASNPHQLLVLMVLTGVLLTIISYLFLRNQLRPIKRLAAASEAFGKGQSVTYHPSGAIEVRAAGNSFLNMRNRIERQIEQRTRMLSGVSHDLRTPLTRLKLGLSMIDQDEDVDAMSRDVEDMEKLLNGFLDFARGDAVDELEKADPATLASKAVERAARDSSHVELSEVDEYSGDIMLRPAAVGRALDNLIGNALRYANKASVSVFVTDKVVRFSVEDDGPGIAPEKREEAIKPFSRLEPARNQDLGTGVGLGLAIAIDVARAHGGTLRLGDSEKLGGLKADLVLAR